MDDPASELERLFFTLGLPSEHVPLALDALERDSQGGRLGSKGQWKEGSRMTSQKWREADGVMQKFGTGLRHDMEFSEFKKVLLGH